MKKDTYFTICWATTFLFVTLTPRHLQLWQGIVLTCLSSILVAFTLPDALKKLKTLLFLKTDVANRAAYKKRFEVCGEAMVAGLISMWALFALSKGLIPIIRLFINN